MKTIVAIMGARSNPKGQDWTLGGYPLILWPYAASLKSELITHSFISTDSSKLTTLIKEYCHGNSDMIIPRPSQFATSTATDLDWISHALVYILSLGINPDLLVHLRASTPLVNPAILDLAIMDFLRDKEATALRSAHALNESPHKMFLKEGNYWKPFINDVEGKKLAGEFYNLPRQNFPVVYHPNGYIDILRPDIIITGLLHGDKIRAFETEFVIEVDRYQDLSWSELIHRESIIYPHLVKRFGRPLGT